MRVMIWADVEGVAGINTWEQTGGKLPLYEDGRRLYTEEVNAAVRGCKAAGVTDIYVVDGHGGGYEGGRGFMTLIPDRLESGARYVLGHPWARFVEPFEAGCDAVVFVGAHAKAGTANGVLSHTVSSESWYLATINGTAVGESGIVAAIAGSWNVPAVFVAGDDATCREVQELLGPTVVAVPVKTALGRYSALHLAPVDSRQRIESGIAKALAEKPQWPQPLRFEPPVTFQVELATPDRATAFMGRTHVEIVGPRTVRATGKNFWEAWDAIWYRN
ncbi:MAG TPA: M55 family metallopeptidase [bacterium]|jgi:D-amino peptidase|nr:M55 family metallopeptidase [bacterium]